MKLFGIMAVVGLISSSVVFAQDLNLTTSSKLLSGQADATWTTNAYPIHHELNSQDLSLTMLGLLTPGKFTHSLKIQASKNMSDQYSPWLLSDGVYGLSRKIWTHNNNNWMLFVSTKAVLPLSKDSYYDRSLITKLSLTPKLVWTYNGWELIDSPSISKHFYKYRSSSSGSVNSSYGVGNTLSISESPNDHLSFSVTFATAATWNQDNEQMPTSYAFEQEISYTFQSNITLAIGHSQEDKMYHGVNESDLHLQLHNPYGSVFYVSASKIF
jgi:hypothetical protein